MSLSTNDQKRFVCDFPGCKSSYQRKEHLNRHKAQHTGVHLFPCPLCDRTLSRNDLLRRHIRRDHSISQLQSTRSATACQACHLAKTRCRGGNPCLYCRARGYECIPQAPNPIQSCQLDDKRSHEDSIDTESRAVQTKHYVNLYFAHFHTHWPILHQATFSIPDEPPLLLQAVITIGLWVSDKSSARQAAVDLHRKVGVWIREQRVQWEKPLPQNDDSGDGLVSKCPIATYQAILLYLIFALIQSSSAYSLDFSLTLPSPDLELLSALVQVCIRNDIFYYPNMIERYDGINSMACM